MKKKPIKVNIETKIPIETILEALDDMELKELQKVVEKAEENIAYLED